MKFLIVFALISIGFFTYSRICSANEIPSIGQSAPAFKLLDSQNKMHQLSDYSGKWLVLYFYPKDDTPGCTNEACHFRDDMFQIEKLGAKVVGISVDDESSHAEFAKKYNLPFTLLADKDGKVANAYGALADLGIFKIAKRYTFLIDPKGKVAKSYLSVDTSKHSEEIIEDLKRLNTN